MLYLDTSVHFHKIEVPILLQKEFYGSCIYIARCLRRLDGRIPHLPSKFLGQRDGRGFFDHLLVVPLDGTVPLAKMDDVAVAIRKNLELDMPWVLDEMLDIHGIVAEGHLGLLLGRFEALLEFFRRIGHAHAFAASAKGSLHDNRIFHLIRDPGTFFRVIDWLLASGNYRNACGYHGIPGFLLISKPCDHLGVRSDKGDVALLA